MRGYLVRRAGASLIVLIVASMLVFAGVRALPGDPALALAGEDHSQRALTAIRAKYDLDKPVPVQYLNWLGHVVRGDFGTSTRTGLSVGSTIVDRLPVTLELAFLSLLVAILIGLSLGVVAAVRRGSVADYVGSTAALVGLSVPHFWLGLMLILVFAIALGLLPASGFVPFVADPVDNLRHMLLPAIVLGTGFAAVIFRQTRAAMLESLSTDYVRTARAKGLSERQVMVRHVLRNSLIPIVTLWGLDFAAVLGGGAILTEKVFDLQGVGQYAADSIGQLDIPPVMAIVMFGAFFVVLLNTIVDILYAALDPRIRLT